jgi:hypothetical protein
VTPVARRGWSLALAALLVGASWAGCDLNPQQLPPSALGGHEGDGAGTTSSGGGSGGMFGGSDAAAGPTEASADGSSAQGATEGGREGDASEEAGDSGDAGDATDGGAAGDGASACTPDPSSDAQCADAGGTPHFYRCVGPSEQPPAGCQLLSVGNVTDLYCCP